MSSTQHHPHAGERPSTPEGGTLPREYGVTRLVILPRDPEWLHAAWEVAPYTWEEVRRRFGADAVNAGRPALRFYAGDRKEFDVDVRLEGGNWYVRMPGGGLSWRAELGLILADGRFALLAVSNVVRMPAGRVSDVVDEKWGVLKAEWDRLFELSGSGRLAAGSLDLARLLAQRWEILRSVSSWPSSWAPGASSWSRSPAPPAGKKFWLMADTEVVVYGATEPGARVTFQGRPVELSPDGTFSFRFALPDGEQRFPIEAVSADGGMREAVEFIVARKTA